MTKPVAFALALISLVFLLQVTPHGHANGHDEAACRLCQVAHLGVTPAVSAATLTLPLVPVGHVAATAPVAEAELYFARSSSRAPPTCGL